MNPHLRDVAIPNDWDRRGLPGWSYHSDALLELEKKGADLIVANDVSHDSGVGASGVMGGDRNRVRIVSRAGVVEWPEMTEDEGAGRLAALIAARLKTVTV